MTKTLEDACYDVFTTIQEMNRNSHNDLSHEEVFKYNLRTRKELSRMFWMMRRGLSDSDKYKDLVKLK